MIYAFKLYKVNDNGTLSVFFAADGQLEYTPSIKYRINKKSALDPTIIIRREPYQSDTLTCVFYGSPADYQTLINFLEVAGDFYIEFEIGDTIKQLPVRLDKLPVLADDSRVDYGDYKFSLISLYEAFEALEFNILGDDNSIVTPS